MNKSRINRVIENMQKEGLDQILVSATPSVYYLILNEPQDYYILTFSIVHFC